MVRGSTGIGPFNTNWAVKSVFAVAAFYLASLNRDYLGIFLWASITWTCCELVLRLTKARQFPTTLPAWLALPLQGIVEAGFVTLACLFVVDHALYGPFLLAMLLLPVWAYLQVVHDHYPGPNYGGDVPSRRTMNTPVSLIWLSLCTIITVVFFQTASGVSLHRGVLLLTVMTVFGVAWNWSEWAVGTRWIEYNRHHASPLVEWPALLWDSVVEIAFAYTPFFVLHHWIT